MQMKQRSAVSTTMVRLTPSIPTKYSMRNAGIQAPRRTNWNPGATGSKWRRSQTASSSGGTVAATPVQRIAQWARAGRQRITAIPMSGMKIIRLSTCSVMRTPFLRSRRRDQRPVEEHSPQDAEQDDVEVGVDRAALQVPHPPADELRPVGQRVDRAVDDVGVEEAAHPGPGAHDRGRQIDEAVDHVLVEPRGQVTHEEHAPDEEEVVELVHVILVEDDPIRQAAQEPAEHRGVDPA